MTETPSEAPTGAVGFVGVLQAHTEALHRTAAIYRQLTRVAALIVVLVAVGLVLVWQKGNDNHDLLVQGNRIRSGNQAILAAVLDCTTPSPVPPPAPGIPDTRKPSDVHQCAERGGQATADAIAQLRLSQDCVALYASGKTPEPCQEVDARIRALEQGENPFTTTTTSGGNR